MKHKALYGISLPEFCKRHDIDPKILLKITEAEILSLDQRYHELRKIFTSTDCDCDCVNNCNIDNVPIIELIKTVREKKESKMKKLIRQKAELGLN